MAGNGLGLVELLQVLLLLIGQDLAVGLDGFVHAAHAAEADDGAAAPLVDPGEGDGGHLRYRC